MSGPLQESQGLLASLRRAVVERLNAFEDIVNPVSIPVIDGGQTDIASAVSDALIKRTQGLCVVVSVPRLDPAEGRPIYVAATVSLQVYERPSQNWSVKGAQKSPEDLCETIMARLMFSDAGVPGWTTMTPWGPLQFDGMRLVYVSTDQVVMEITFTTQTLLSVTVV